MEATAQKKLTRKEKIAQGLPKPLGSRKHRKAEILKANKEECFYAVLNDLRSSPRKMRLLADLIRGQKVERALAILKLSGKAAAEPLYKLLKSAITNATIKAEKLGMDCNVEDLFVSIVTVDGGPMLKRIRPAPQGRAYRVRKRSNHIRIEVDFIGEQETQE